LLRQSTTRPSNEQWSILFHVYTAFFVLSYGVKALYFMLSDNPSFALWRYPRLDDVPWYAVLGSVIAFAFWLLTWATYRYVQRRLSTPDRTLEAPAEQNLGPVIVGLLAVVLFFVQNWQSVVTKFTTSTIFVRSMVATSNDYESGALGVTGLIGQFEIAIVACLTAYAVLHRRWMLVLACGLFHLGQAVVSDGSRFALLSAAGFIPISYYTLHWKRPEHRRWLYPSIYVAAFALPLVVAPLLVLRSESRLPTYAGGDETLARAGLSTFDSLDHLINYLYRLPIDFTGGRALEEFWYLIPRAVYRDKPFLYAINGLQEVVYPGSIGPEHHHHLYGMYPLGCVTMALDMIGPVGFIAHGCAIGAILALFDHWISGRSFVRHGMFAINLLFLYHAVRSGILHYLVGAIGGCFLPALVMAQADKLGRAIKLMTRTPTTSAVNRDPSRLLES
jgi:hypothetical protein